MVILDYPAEIKEAIKIYEPYLDAHNESIENAPPEVVSAYEKCRKWAWEQDQ